MAGANETRGVSEAGGVMTAGAGAGAAAVVPWYGKRERVPVCSLV